MSVFMTQNNSSFRASSRFSPCSMTLGRKQRDLPTRMLCLGLQEDKSEGRGSSEVPPSLPSYPSAGHRADSPAPRSQEVLEMLPAALKMDKHTQLESINRAYEWPVELPFIEGASWSPKQKTAEFEP